MRMVTPLTRLTSLCVLSSLAATTLMNFAVPSVQAASTPKTLVIATDLPLGSKNFDSSDSINKAIALYLK